MSGLDRTNPIQHTPNSAPVGQITPPIGGGQHQQGQQGLVVQGGPPPTLVQQQRGGEDFAQGNPFGGPPIQGQGHGQGIFTPPLGQQGLFNSRQTPIPKQEPQQHITSGDGQGQQVSFNSKQAPIQKPEPQQQIKIGHGQVEQVSFNSNQPTTLKKERQQINLGSSNVQQGFLNSKQLSSKESQKKIKIGHGQVQQGSFNSEQPQISPQMLQQQFTSGYGQGQHIPFNSRQTPIPSQSLQQHVDISPGQKEHISFNSKQTQNPQSATKNRIVIGGGQVQQNTCTTQSLTKAESEHIILKGKLCLERNSKNPQILEIHDRLRSGELDNPLSTPEEKVKIANSMLSKLDLIARQALSDRDWTTLKQAESMIKVLSDLQRLFKSEVGQPSIHDLQPNLSEKETLREAFNTCQEAINTGNADKLDAAAIKLGKILAKSLKHKSEEVKTNLITSSGDKFKNELLAHLIKIGTQGLGKTYDSCKPEIRQFLDRAYFEYVSRATGNRQIDDKIRIEGRTFKSVAKSVGDREETIAKGGAQIAKGSFGVVYKYKDSKEIPVAVKSISFKASTDLETSQKAREKVSKSAAHELAIHVKAQGGLNCNHPNIVGLKGSVPEENGMVIVMEMCPGGTIFGAKAKIRELASGKLVDSKGDVHHLSGDARDHQGLANLVCSALVKDMVQGLKQLHSNGVCHMDMKGPNVIIGSDGLAKIADFGTGIKMDLELDHISFNKAESNFHIPESPVWMPPEAIAVKIMHIDIKLFSDAFTNFGEVTLQRHIKTIDIYGNEIPPNRRKKPDINAMELQIIAKGDLKMLDQWVKIRPQLDQILEEVEAEMSQENFNGLSQDLKEKIAKEWEGPLKIMSILDMERMVNETRSAPIDPFKCDIWGLGATIMDLFYGTTGIETGGGSMIDQQNAIIGYGDSDRTDTITDVRKQRWATQNGQPVENAPGNPMLDDLLDHLMHRDPNQRFTIEQVLDHPFIRSLGNLDNSMVRHLIKVLTGQGDAQDMEKMQIFIKK